MMKASATSVLEKEKEKVSWSALRSAPMKTTPWHSAKIGFHSATCVD